MNPQPPAQMQRQGVTHFDPFFQGETTAHPAIVAHVKLGGMIGVSRMIHQRDAGESGSFAGCCARVANQAPAMEYIASDAEITIIRNLLLNDIS